MGLGSAARAQTATPSFVLAGQSAWVAPGAGFVMRFQSRERARRAPRSRSPPTTRCESRTAFDASVSGGSLPPSRERTTFAFDTLVTDPATGQRLLAYPTTAISDGGVYPLEVDLRSANDESLAHFVTHVVVAPVGADGALTVGGPLNVAWVWPLRADPAYVAGTVPINPSTLADLQPTGRLGRQATQLAADPDVPLTLAPSPETLDAWTALSGRIPELSGGAAQLRSTVPRDQVLTGPFVPLDLPSIGARRPRAASSTPSWPGASRRSRPSSARTSTRAPRSPVISTRTPCGSSRTPAPASWCWKATTLTPADEKYTPAHPYKMQAVPGDDSSAVTVVATDPGFEQFLTGDDPPALRAAHLLAGLSLVAGEQPSIARGVAIANPDRWDADDTFVAAVLGRSAREPAPPPHDRRRAARGGAERRRSDDEPDGAPVYRQLAPYAPPARP